MLHRPYQRGGFMDFGSKADSLVSYAVSVTGVGVGVTTVRDANLLSDALPLINFASAALGLLLVILSIVGVAFRIYIDYSNMKRNRPQ